MLSKWRINLFLRDEFSFVPKLFSKRKLLPLVLKVTVTVFKKISMSQFLMT